MRFLLSVLVLVWGCGPLTAAAENLSVLVWNVQRGANLFDQGPEKALKVIRDAKANLVLMQESYDIDGDRPTLGLWLASQLGWQAHQGSSPHLCILTKFAIVETFKHEGWHGIGARIRTPQGDFLAWSCWIDYRAYLPDFLTENPTATLAELMACETTGSDRAKQTTALLARLKKLGHLDSPLPLLVGGDWNSPSHLDYGPDTKHLHHGHVIPLPSSLAIEQAGFTDTFRQVHPSPLKYPGMTWTTINRTNRKTHQPVALDRIDRLYLRGSGLRPVTATTLPSPLEKDTIRKVSRSFPSDHCAVLTTFGAPRGVSPR